MVNDFEAVDSEVGQFSGSIVKSPTASSAVDMPASGVVEFRQALVEKYYKGSKGLISALRDVGDDGITGLLTALIEQVIQETDHLLGNELVSTHNGDLRDASIISFKRAEVLEKAIKAVQTKRDIEKQSGLDVDSPHMEIVFRYFMEVARDALEAIAATEEQHDLFFRSVIEQTNNWKKDIKDRVLSATAEAG